MRTPIKAIRDACDKLLPRKADIVFQNREGNREYDFVLSARRTLPGVSAMLRARNESRKIITCLSSIFRLFDEIVFIDNGSTDDTQDLVRRFKAEHDANDILTIFQYPYHIARCGDQHWSTPSSSLHSLVYYYNWCLSKCHCQYVFKWDADMAVAANGSCMLRDLFGKLPQEVPTLWSFRVQTIYRDNSGSWYAARGEINTEPRLAPNCAAVRYHKARYFEELRSEIYIRRQQFHPVCIYELKDVSEDEFSHWNTTDFPTERKRREWRHFQQVKQGLLQDPTFERLTGEFIEQMHR
jgi:hypothetical protein